MVRHFLVHWRSSGNGLKNKAFRARRGWHIFYFHGQVLESGSARATQMEKSISSRTVVQFGPFEADFRTRELRRYGVNLKLVGQPFEVLAMLLERPGQLVTREELLARLWPTDTFVDFDHGLNAVVNKLRDALNDSAEKPKYVETLPRRGYRFISAVGLHDSRNLLGEPSSPKIQSLVVLPLENLSNDPEQEYFADGMTDQLITNLSQISALKIVSRTSAMRYKRTKKSLPEIARELHVDAVVEGAVMWVCGRVRISAQLIEAPTDHHLWAASYERDLDDVLSLQEEVTRAIVSEIRVKLTAHEQARLANTHQTHPEAYRLYLKGRFYWYKLTPQAMQKAIEYFQQALEKDPAYAPAYAGLADTYNTLAFFTVFPPREVVPKAKAAAARALEIDANFAEAHVSLGWAGFTYDLDWPAAGKHFERAVVLNPAYPVAHSFYSLYLGALGRSEEGLTEAKRALDLDPVSPAVLHYVVVQLYMARQFDEAIEQCRKTMELDSSFTPAHRVLAEVYAAKGMYSESLAEYEKYATLSGGSPGSKAFVGYAHAQLGARNQAVRVLDQLGAASKQRYVPALSFAVVYVGLRELDQAFLWLEKAYDERTNSLAYLKVQATWDPLRSDPRFTDLLRRIGLSP